VRTCSPTMPGRTKGSACSGLPTIASSCCACASCCVSCYCLRPCSTWWRHRCTRGLVVGRGYRVHLVDVVPGRVRAAAGHGLVTAEVGDARRLTQADASVDAVLLLGPLYHLVGRAERIAALVEARGSCGPVVSWWPRLSDGLWRFLTGRSAVASPPTSRTSWCRRCPAVCMTPPSDFTDAFFHTAAQLP
jgi:hypothetical protein